MKSLWAGIVFVAMTFSAMSAPQDAQTVRLPSRINTEQGGQWVKKLFEDGIYVRQTGEYKVLAANKSRSYPAGDFAIMWGIGTSAGDQEMTQDEYGRIWRIMNYLSQKGFRVLMNVRTEGHHLKEAVETTGISVVLYSGHGNETGFYDFFHNRIGYDLFTKKAKSLYQFILSACYGTEAHGLYNPPADMMMYTWAGTTNSNDLENFLMGSWTGLEGKERAVRQ